MQYQQVPQTYTDKEFVDPSLQENVRLNFTRKVFSIVSIQLLLTAVVSTLQMNSQGFYDALQNLYAVAWISLLVSTLWLSFSSTAAKEYPKNYILLAIFTVSEAIIVGDFCVAVNEPDVILSAFILTVGITIALTTYAITTKTDITIFGGIIFILSVVTFLLFIVNLFFMGFHGLRSLILFSSTVSYAIYLIYDVQLILGDKSRGISIDNYVLGAMMLYTDIIRIFIRIVQLLQEEKKK